MFKVSDPFSVFLEKNFDRIVAGLEDLVKIQFCNDLIKTFLRSGLNIFQYTFPGLVNETDAHLARFTAGFQHRNELFFLDLRVDIENPVCGKCVEIVIVPEKFLLIVPHDAECENIGPAVG